MIRKRKEITVNTAHRSNLLEICHRFTKNKAAMIGLIMLIIIVGFSVCADLIVPYDVAVTNTFWARTSSDEMFGRESCMDRERHCPLRFFVPC